MKKQPYEFLVRWSVNGSKSGAHVKRCLITDDGKVIEGDPERASFDVNDKDFGELAKAFSLELIAERDQLRKDLQAATETIASMEDCRTERDALRLQLDAEQAKVKKYESECKSLKRSVETMEAHPDVVEANRRKEIAAAQAAIDKAEKARSAAQERLAALGEPVKG